MQRAAFTAAATSAIALLAAASLAVGSAAAATRLPDLSITRVGPSSLYSYARFSDTLTVTNSGTAPAKAIAVKYLYPSVVGASAGVGVAVLRVCKSGRGGGCRTIGYEFTPNVGRGLAPNHSVSFSITAQSPGYGSLSESFSVEPKPPGPQLNRVSHSTGDSLPVHAPPLPEAPSGVSAGRVGDNLQVTWTPAPATAEAITSSTVTLTPTGESSAPPLKAIVFGPGGSAALGPVVPQTTYLITVTSTDSSGSSPPSTSVSFTTPASTVVPSAPAEVRAYWLSGTAPTGVLLTSWVEGTPGDSQIDQYQVTAEPGEPELAAPRTMTESGTARNVEFTLYDEMPWSIRVRAHNVAGWGPWSPTIVVAGV
jgi:hypothetical protein